MEEECKNIYKINTLVNEDGELQYYQIQTLLFGKWHTVRVFNASDATEISRYRLYISMLEEMGDKIIYE